ncbi:MAG TPA: mechanosensitive ion channel family protein [Casimicrobiaceae bacterium]|nr:mechanosensitive ion channel family protein [Casimicrobiaceae bacterium]
MIRIFRCVLGASLAASVFATAAQQVDTVTPARQSESVVVANRTVVVLRGPIAGYSAQERANNVRERIQAILDSDKSPAVSTEDTEDGTQVLLGGKLAFLITRIDIDPQLGETTRNVAREAGIRLETAVTEYREQHTPQYLLVHIAWAVLATGVYVALLWLLFRATRWAGLRFALLAGARAERVHVHGVSLLDPQQVRWVARRLFAVFAWLIALFATYSWVTFVLKQFPYTRPWGEHMEGNLFGLAGDFALGIVQALPGLLVVIVILLIARLIVRIANLFFDRVEHGVVSMGGLDEDTAVPTRRIFQIIVWAIAIALAFPHLPGAQTDAFKGVSVLFGLMVSIGASGVVGQAASGFILMYTRAFRAGEYVRIGEVEGTVVALGTFATRLRTGLGEEILLPNSVALQNTTKNYSRIVDGPGFVVNTGVTIGYSTPWRQVHAMLEEAARQTPGIASDPPPIVRQTALSDFYVEYRLAAFTAIEDAARRMEVLSELHANIQDRFNEHGVQIMSPHYMTDTATPQVVPKDRWFTPPAQGPEA